MTTLACQLAVLSAKVKFWWWSRHEQHPGSATQTSCKQSCQLLRLWSAMTTSEHYSTNVQTFVAEDSRRGSDNFRRLPNVAVRSSKPWRDLVSFLLRTHTQHLALFTAGLFCLESELHFSRNCESGVRNCSLRMWSLVRGQWTCHVVVFVDSTLGYRITLTQHNTDTAFLCMVFGLFDLRQGIWF